MKALLVLSLTVLVQVISIQPVLAAGYCDHLQSERVQKLNEIFQQDLARPSIWADYHPGSLPMLVIDNKASGKCVFVIQNGQVRGIEDLKDYWPQTQTGYSFIPNSKYYPKYPVSDIGRDPKPDMFDCCAGIQNQRQELNAILQKYDFKAAHVHWWTSTDKTDPNEKRLFTAGLFATLVHEAFHFLYQNRGLSQKAWSNQTMVTGAIPGFVQRQCYNYSPQSVQTLLAESEALVNAYLSFNNKLQTKKYLLEFVSLRKKRYAGAPHFPTKGRPFSHINNCEKLEAQMEYHEGVANFAGIVTSLKADLYTQIEVLNILKDSLPTKENPQGSITINYGFGTLQLLILERLLGPQEFNKLTQKLTQNKVSDNFVNSIAQAAALP